MIISLSKHVKANGNNPILPPSQITSEARVMTEQGESQGMGYRGGTMPENTGFPLPCLPLCAGACHWDSRPCGRCCRGHCGPSRPDLREKQGQWHERGAVRVKVSKDPAHQLGGTHAVLPSTRCWALEKAGKMPYSLWWSQHPAQYLAEWAHNDCVQWGPGTHLHFSRGTWNETGSHPFIHLLNSSLSTAFFVEHANGGLMEGGPVLTFPSSFIQRALEMFGKWCL